MWKLGCGKVLGPREWGGVTFYESLTNLSLRSCPLIIYKALEAVAGCGCQDVERFWGPGIGGGRLILQICDSP